MNNLIYKYNLNINEAVKRISNSCSIQTYPVGMAGGRASANMNSGKDTEVIYQNCLMEIAKLIDDDSSINNKDKKEAFDIIVKEINERLKKYNESKLNKALGSAQMGSIFGDLITMLIFGIILAAIFVIGAKIFG